MKYIIVLLFSFIIFGSETTVELKKGGAVTAFTKEDGFKLSDKAINNLGIKFSPIKGSGPWVVPKSALVRIKYSTGVYRKWDNWITLVLVKVLSQTKNTVTIRSVDLEAQDLVAISGVTFLRMTDADLNSDTVDSCAH
ncbi:hypothetical protein M902_2597 [Bacteriovorax sp. BAL6_X]|uniref:hypothetical protein n=1 Tax=Bacteriovorax sp. BAL6_X TaxID=1201290 RepID=UPI00038579A3|nr:hypothetical protein [Bacteriovorax sp. BAL6_X]EPZ51101.1 hypothetical protein M902_2597 [Bacteriovorax sp. BAL6_X]